MKLIHATQRGGTIEHTGPPLPPGDTAVIPVNEDGTFEAPAELAGCLLRVLHPLVQPAPATKKGRKESES